MKRGRRLIRAFMLVLPALALALPPAARAAADPAGAAAVHLKVEGTLAADGKLTGTLTVNLAGPLAAEARAALAERDPAKRAARLSAFAPKSLATTLSASAGDAAAGAGPLTLSGAVSSTAFARRDKETLTVKADWIAQPETDAPVMQQYLLALPEGTQAPDLPSPYSVVTPGGGRYAIWALVDGDSPQRLTLQREMLAAGTQRSELSEAAAEHDRLIIRLTLPAPGATRPGAARTP